MVMHFSKFLFGRMWNKILPLYVLIPWDNSLFKQSVLRKIMRNMGLVLPFQHRVVNVVHVTEYQK